MKRLLIILLISSFSFIVYAPTIRCFIIVESSPIRLYSDDFIKYANHLGKLESNNNPHSINVFGYFSEYQFAEKTLHFIGYKDITLSKFKKNPNIFPEDKQLEALKTLTDINKLLIHPYEFYIGSIIDNVIITRSGLLAAVHLGGLKSVVLFLSSNGIINKCDKFGTSIKDYIRIFQGYNI